MLLEGTVINGAIVLDGGEQLPEGGRVEVALKEQQGQLAVEQTPQRPQVASQGATA